LLLSNHQRILHDVAKTVQLAVFLNIFLIFFVPYIFVILFLFLFPRTTEAGLFSANSAPD
jgi:hypothetical protein